MLKFDVSSPLCQTCWITTVLSSYSGVDPQIIIIGDKTKNDAPTKNTDLECLHLSFSPDVHIALQIPQENNMADET